MDQPNTRIEVVVLGFPPDEEVVSDTRRWLQEAIEILQTAYGSGFDFRIIEASTFNSHYRDIVLGFLAACSEHHDCLDIYWLSYLNWVIDHPDESTTAAALTLFGKSRSVAELFVREVQANPDMFRPRPKALFVAARESSLCQQDLRGASHEEYPSSVAIETSGHREFIFHEFFHQFGASEGYDSERVTENGCEDCWMQYNAAKGTHLCQRHLDEVSEFLRGLRTKRDQ